MSPWHLVPHLFSVVVFVMPGFISLNINVDTKTMQIKTVPVHSACTSLTLNINASFSPHMIPTEAHGKAVCFCGKFYNVYTGEDCSEIRQTARPV